MLVLTLKRNNKIEIGGVITIELIRIQEGKTHLKIIFSPEDTKQIVIGSNNEVQINQDIKVVVTEIVSSKKVRMGISAPRNLKILRFPRETDKSP